MKGIELVTLAAMGGYYVKCILRESVKIWTEFVGLA